MTSKNRVLAAVAFALALVATVRGGAQAGTPGIDGAKTITAANTVVNGYDYLISAVAGTRTITVNNIANLSHAGLTALGPGSVVLLYQANGATIDDTDTANYGTITNGNQAGYYEFATVGSVSGSPDPSLVAAPTRRGVYGTVTSVIDNIFGWGKDDH